jgi:23S rRNA pseudouridine2605 synthase
MAKERLQKIIAQAGVASRREAEELIREGRVTINGKVADELGTKADPERDHVKVDGKLITGLEEKRYILLNKPREVMTTVEDPEGRKTVVGLIRGVKERIYPVGRLDYHSEGLIVLTNDGDLAFKVAHPSQGSVKTYHVKVRGVPDERMVDKLRRGITIDGKRTLPCEIDRMKTTGRSDAEGNSWFEIRLREGRTQQIRRMFQALGHPVSKLKRIAIGPIEDSRLAPGEWRELSPQEVRLLAEVKDPRQSQPRPLARQRKAKVAGEGAERAHPKPRKASSAKASSARTSSGKTSSGKAPAGRTRTTTLAARAGSGTRAVPAGRKAAAGGRTSAGVSRSGGAAPDGRGRAGKSGSAAPARSSRSVAARTGSTKSSGASPRSRKK